MLPDLNGRGKGSTICTQCAKCRPTLSEITCTNATGSFRRATETRPSGIRLRVELRFSHFKHGHQWLCQPALSSISAFCTLLDTRFVLPVVRNVHSSHLSSLHQHLHKKVSYKGIVKKQLSDGPSLRQGRFCSMGRQSRSIGLEWDHNRMSMGRQWASKVRREH